jgi:CRISPR-associated exonuclease Cas4
MSYDESSLLPISALQHYVFCPRQCALIHVECVWSENRYTAEGRARHERVDRPESELRDGVRFEYAVPLRSLALGLVGKADCVEFRPDGPYPVEHKRGRPKPDHCDWVQLCAQAICLEEMLDCHIPEGAIFYGQPRRRQVVELNEQLRDETARTARAIHAMIESRTTPAPIYHQKKCASCSLLDICMPDKFHSVSDYLKKAMT